MDPQHPNTGPNAHTMDAHTLDVWKRQAAEAAVASIPQGAVVGLGTGTTAELMLEALAQRVRSGLQVTGVATSDQTQARATALGIAVAPLDETPALDVSIDGADEITLTTFDALKGHGGALLHEKLVAAASRYRILIVDATKVVERLLMGSVIPVEVVPFGWRHTAGRLAALGAAPTRRPATDAQPGVADAAPFLTDSGNYVLDCAFGAVADPAALANALKGAIGVIEHGLFIGMTDRVYVGGPDGVRAYERPR